MWYNRSYWKTSTARDDRRSSNHQPLLTSYTTGCIPARGQAGKPLFILLFIPPCCTADRGVCRKRRLPNAFSKHAQPNLACARQVDAAVSTCVKTNLMQNENHSRVFNGSGFVFSRVSLVGRRIHTGVVRIRRDRHSDGTTGMQNNHPSKRTIYGVSKNLKTKRIFENIITFTLVPVPLNKRIFQFPLEYTDRFYLHFEILFLL